MLLGIDPSDIEGGALILALETKNGKRIPNAKRDQKTPERMAAAKKYVLDNHESAQLRSLSSEYNCVGMVFAARRTVIDDDHVEMILREDGYRQINNKSELQIGDVVVYRNDGMISHVGTIARVSPNVREAQWEITVLSQWGADGEYFHLIDDVNPRFGTPSRILDR